MASLKHELGELSSERMLATKKAWLRTLNSKPECFNQSVFERRLELAESHRDYKDGTDFCYGIFPKGHKAAVAIVEIAYTRESRKWIKMLSLYLSPSLDLSVDQNAPDFSELADIFSVAMIGTIKLSGVHTSRVVKLYARTPMLLSFFRFVAEKLPLTLKAMDNGSGVSNIKISVEGRWLVIRI